MSDHPMRLQVGEDAESAVAIAAFERATTSAGPAGGTLAGHAAEKLPAEGQLPRVHRRGGGVPAHVGPGILRVSFRFPMDGSVSPDAARILNRAVRPLLAALRTLTPLVSYFGRDVVSVKIGGVRHDVAAIGFAHDGETEEGVFEAFLGVGRSSRGDLVSLAALLGDAPLHDLEARVTRAFVAAGAVAGPLVPLLLAAESPAWDAVTETPFARVGAARSPIAVGGDFFASSDWLRHLNAGLRDLPASPTDVDVLALFGREAPKGSVLLGVSSPAVLAATVLRALRGGSPSKEAP